MTHSARYAWRSPHLGHFTDVDATCVLDLDSTCHTGGWCFGSRFGNWRVHYAPRIDHDRVLGYRWGGGLMGPCCGAWWLSAEPSETAEFADCGHWCASGHCVHEGKEP